MRIAIWSEALVGRQTGTKTMLQNLVRAWLRDYATEVSITFVVASPQDAIVIDTLFPIGNWQTKVLPGGKWAQRVAWLTGSKSLTPTIGLHDIYLSGWHWPLGRDDRPFVGIVHDLRPLDPDWSDPTISALRRWIWLALYRLSARRCLATAAAIVTPSNFTLDHISRIGFAPRQPVRVIPHGVDYDAWSAPLDELALDAALGRLGLSTRTRFVLSIGPHAPHKNMYRLVQAFADGLGHSDPDAHLVLAGAMNVETARIERLIRKSGLEDRVHLLGRVPFDDLVVLMRSARVFAFVSQFEGFGIPVAEAFSAGTPVVTSSSTSLQEVAGDAALTVDPTDVLAISNAILLFWYDEAIRRDYSIRAATRVREFRWDAAARAYFELFQSVKGQA